MYIVDVILYWMYSTMRSPFRNYWSMYVLCLKFIDCSPQLAITRNNNDNG